MGRIIKAAQLEEERHSISRHPQRYGETVDNRVDEAALRQVAIDLAVEMTRRLTGIYIDENPSLLVSIYHRAFSGVGLLSDAELRVHPDDRRLVADDEITGGRGGCRLLSDDAVGRGGFRLNTEFGEIDGSLDTMLALFRTVLGGES
jgi:flagellar biosynthesis/type III secretory pathway protein FliH